MINCLISDCAGRHTTHVPAGGTAKRFILFNNKSKTNVAFHPAACLHEAPFTKAGQLARNNGRLPYLTEHHNQSITATFTKQLMHPGLRKYCRRDGQ